VTSDGSDPTNNHVAQTIHNRACISNPPPPHGHLPSQSLAANEVTIRETYSLPTSSADQYNPKHCCSSGKGHVTIARRPDVCFDTILHDHHLYYTYLSNSPPINNRPLPLLPPSGRIPCQSSSSNKTEPSQFVLLPPRIPARRPSSTPAVFNPVPRSGQ